MTLHFGFTCTVPTRGEFFSGGLILFPPSTFPPRLIQAKGNFRWKLQSDTSFSPQASEEFC